MDLFRLKSKNGFTLIEMLVVIGIIAVLIAIVVPTVTNSTEKSREATDIANIRSTLSELALAAMVDNDYSPLTMDLQQRKAGWTTEGIQETLESLTKNHVVGAPADGNGNTALLEWLAGEEAVQVTFSGEAIEGSGSSGGSGSGVNRAEGKYIEDENDVKSVITGLAAFIYDTMQGSSTGQIRYEGSRNNAAGLPAGYEWLATDYKVLHPSTFTTKNVEWGNSKGTYSDYLAGTDISDALVAAKTDKAAMQTDIYLDLKTNLPIAVGYYKDGTESSDYMITFLDENGNPAETRDIGNYAGYRQCFAYQKEYVLEHFDEDTSPANRWGND